MMKNTYILKKLHLGKTILLVSFLLIFYQNTLSAKENIRIGMFQNKPLSFSDELGQAHGIYPDIIREIARINHWNIEFVIDTWSGSLESLKTGNIDLMVSIVYSKERDKIFDFSKEPVVTAWGQIYSTQDSGIFSILDLEGKTVAIMEKDINAKNFIELSEKFNLHINFIKTKTYDDVCSLIITKKADAGVINNINGEFLKRHFAILGTPVMFSPVTAVFAASENKNQHLLNTIDSTLVGWRNDKNSIYFDFMNEWFGAKKGNFNFPYKLIGIILSIVSVMVIFLFVWARVLNKQVKIRTKELSESEEKYRLLFNSSNDAVFVHQPSLDGVPTKFLEINNTAQKMYGYSRDELLGLSPMNLVQIKTHEEVIGHVQKTLKDGYNIFEIIHKTKYDKEFPVEVSAYYFNFKGEPTILSIVRDITERKRAEQTLKESEKQYRLLFQNMAQGAFYQDADGKITNYNQNALDMFGLTPDQFVGKTSLDPHWNVIHEDWSDFPGDQHPSMVALKTGKPVKDIIAGVFNIPKNNYVWLNINAIPQFKENETKPYQVFVTLHDITALKKAEAEVRQIHKMESIGTLAGGVAHDFNNILFPILGHSEMLLDDLPEDNPSRINAAEIYSGVIRAKDLVQQILTFSRQETAEVKPIKLQPVLEEALNLIRSTIPTTIEIKKNIISDVLIIKANPTKIHQIVLNLTTNAYHSMEEKGGIIEVTLTRAVIEQTEVLTPKMQPGNYALLTVKDSGTGISAEVLEKIFDPFFTTKEQGKGTGMGLSVVHGIINKMKGAIHVNSEPGKGTEFNVYLPLENNSHGFETNKLETAIQKGSESILLVDDETSIINMEKQMLERLGYKVYCQTDSLKAIEIFKENPYKFDLIITDFAMPNMAGDQLASELLKIRPDIPIILNTGYSEKMTPEKLKAAGIAEILMKPIMKKDLSQKIIDVLKKR